VRVREGGSSLSQRISADVSRLIRWAYTSLVEQRTCTERRQQTNRQLDWTGRRDIDRANLRQLTRIGRICPFSRRLCML